MAKLDKLIMEVVYALIFVVVGYLITTYLSTTLAAAMSIALPAYFTSLTPVIWIVVFFAVVIYVITAAMHHGGK